MKHHIPANQPASGEELAELEGLGVHIVEQGALEQSVQSKAARELNESELEDKQKRFLRLQVTLDRRLEQLEKTRESMAKAKSTTTARYQGFVDKAERLEAEIDELRANMGDIEDEIRGIEARIEQADTESAIALGKQTGSPIRTAETVDVKPNISQLEAPTGELAGMLVPRRQAAIAAELKRHDAFRAEENAEPDSESDAYTPPTNSRRQRSLRSRNRAHSSASASEGAASFHEASEDNGNDSAVADEMGLGSDELGAATVGQMRRSRIQQLDTNDDGNEAMYRQRLLDWSFARWRERQDLGDQCACGQPNANVKAESASFVEVGGHRAPREHIAEEPYLPDPGKTDYKIRAHDPSKPALRVPRQIWDRLLEYQKAAMRWMFTLHQQGAGGILGDEMGLGKTVQVASFLASMYHTRLLSKPSIVVCPATLMHQWVREFHTWWPALRVVILHNTGYAMRIGSATDEGSAEPEDAYHSLSSDLPADVETAAWDTGKMANSRFGGDTIPAPGMPELEYDSADDYEYDAYGSRIRRKRRPRGQFDWRKQQKRLKKMKKAKNKYVSKAARENLRKAEKLVDYVQQQGHIVIVTYSGLQIYAQSILSRQWGYAVLDEGHMIRNPDAEATLVCKRLDTRHRILVTGTPIQNNLTELWSLFDFIFPGRLGTLPVFNNQFVVPITTGGYASANSLQVRAGYRCACILRDLIDPYLLRRLKADVARDLPQKTEQVLFCRLMPMQRSAYKAFLTSSDMERILSGKVQMLFGVDVARKICDHPDLLLLSTMKSANSTHRMAADVHEAARAAVAHGDGSVDGDSNEGGNDDGDDLSDYNPATDTSELPPDYGDWHKSGKLTVVRALLRMWKPQGHKVLIFCQTRQMLDIVESMVKAMPDMVYRRMDGSTPVQHRTAMVDEYNRDSSIFVFLLTTRVGGLGINLTGADRVILYSPDWNPSSDMQARERAWRLGQTRDVTIYRLMTAGTIEEKIYSRQIYKQFLSNKILSDPKQKRFFHSQSLRDLFSLAGFNDSGPEDNGDDNDTAHGHRQMSIPRHQYNSGLLERDTRTSTGRMFANAQVFPKPRNDDGENANSNNSNSGSGGGSVKDNSNQSRSGIGGSEGASTESAAGAKPDTIGSIDGVVRLEQYKPVDESENEGTSSASSSNNNDSQQKTRADSTEARKGDESEDRVLQSLFEMSGVVHSAMEHDAIINSRSDGEDAQAIEQEAERIARDARLALRQSQRSRRQVDVRVPTWTGMSGHAGIPQAGGGQASGRTSAYVAPPPNAALGLNLPPKVLELERQQREVQRMGIRAVGTPRPELAQSSNISSFHNNHGSGFSSMPRNAALGRITPSSSVVSSLSMGHSDSAGFGSHMVAGMQRQGNGRGGTGISSSTLLAGLKARSEDIGPGSSASMRSPQSQHNWIGHVPDATHGSRNSSVAPRSPGLANLGLRPHGERPSLFSGSAGDRNRKMSAGARGSAGVVSSSLRSVLSSSAVKDRPHPVVLGDNEKPVIERARGMLAHKGGEMPSRDLIEALRLVFPHLELERLKELIGTIADLQSRSAGRDKNASRIGIGQNTQKIWRLRDK